MSPLPSKQAPSSVIVIGMAGSGKTALMTRLVSDLARKQSRSYVVNLDAAALHVPFAPHIDIRDTVNYKKVMETYKLGPNGGIVTSLNLFATRFDQVMKYVEERADQVKHVLVDTPGQIEVFTWSASGQIITESLASTLPTAIVYVADTPRSSNPSTFMSNMTYACSIMYKTKLPLIIAFNKTDVLSHEFAIDWMKDYDSFEMALRSEKSFMSTLTRSMSLMLSEFYKSIRCVGVSAVTGEGINQLLEAVAESRHDYFDTYVPYMEQKVREKEESLQKAKLEQHQTGEEQSEEEEEQTYDEAEDEREFEEFMKKIQIKE